MKVFITSLLLLTFLSACSDDHVKAFAEKGHPIPAFTLTSLMGEKVSSAELFKDKVVVLNIWATWCPPCRKEMPDLVKLSKMLPQGKFLVVGLATDKNLQHVKAFVNEHGVTFPIYWDNGGQNIAANILGVSRYPETLILNRKGIFVEKIVGGFPWAAPQVKAILQAIYETGEIPPAKGEKQ